MIPNLNLNWLQLNEHAIFVTAYRKYFQFMSAIKWLFRIIVPIHGICETFRDKAFYGSFFCNLWMEIQLCKATTALPSEGIVFMDSMLCPQPNMMWAFSILHCWLCLHCADIWVKAWEDNAPFPSFLQNTGQDNVEEGVHVEVGW